LATTSKPLVCRIRDWGDGGLSHLLVHVECWAGGITGAAEVRFKVHIQ
jgi:hypothetical protein